MKLFLITLLISFIITADAKSWCFEPSTPYSKPNKPSVPFCINEFSRTHTCSAFILNSYNSDIEAYNRDVNNYIRDLQNYVDDAFDYAECEIRSLD